MLVVPSNGVTLNKKRLLGIYIFPDCANFWQSCSQDSVLQYVQLALRNLQPVVQSAPHMYKNEG